MRMRAVFPHLGERNTGQCGLDHQFVIVEGDRPLHLDVDLLAIPPERPVPCCAKGTTRAGAMPFLAAPNQPSSLSSVIGTSRTRIAVAL